MSLLSLSKIFCLLLVGVALHTLSPVIPAAQYVASLTMQLPATTENLYLTTLSLCSNHTEQRPNCSMFESLYVFRTTEFTLSYISCNLPTDFWVDSLPFLCSFQYYNEIIMQLWHFLNLLLSAEISACVVLFYLFHPALKFPLATDPHDLTNSL